MAPTKSNHQASEPGRKRQKTQGTRDSETKWDAQAVIAHLAPFTYRSQPRPITHKRDPTTSPLSRMFFDNSETAHIAARQHALEQGYDLRISSRGPDHLDLHCFKARRVGEGKGCPVIWRFEKMVGAARWTVRHGAEEQRHNHDLGQTKDSAPWLTALTWEEEVYIHKLGQAGYIVGLDVFEEVSKIHDVINVLRKSSRKPLLLSTRVLHHVWSQAKIVSTRKEGSSAADSSSSSTSSSTPDTLRSPPCKFWPPPSVPAISSPCKFWPPPPSRPSALTPTTQRNSHQPALNGPLPSSSGRLVGSAPPSAPIPVAHSSLPQRSTLSWVGPEASIKEIQTYGRDVVLTSPYDGPLIPTLQVHRAGPNLYFTNSSGITFSRVFDPQYPWGSLETYGETTLSPRAILPRILIAVEVEASEKELLPRGTRLVRQSKPNLWLLVRPEQRPMAAFG